MASTYSQYLRLELIGTGEQTGTWGNTTNTNLGTLLDQAVAGTATIDVTLGDVTLTALNGASDQSRQAILKVTGTPVAARNIIAPESSKWYLVSNDCGQTITLKGSTTSGYAIADGETLLMFWNGTDFVPGSSTALGYTPVNKAGDTMSGALYLPAATPTLSTQATTKAYVDAAVSGAVGGNFVLKAGDTMTGPLVLPGAPTLSLQAATKGYVDGAISGAGYATQAWVLSQSYVTTTTSSLTNYYTKTDSDSRYVSTSTQNLQYYPLSTTVAATYATIASLSNYVSTSTTSLLYYYTKTESDGRYVTSSSLTTTLSGYVTSTYLTTNYSTTAQINTALSGYVTGTYLTTNYYDKTTIDSGLTYFMPKTGGTFTGAVTFNATPTSLNWNFNGNTGFALSGGNVYLNMSGATPYTFQSNGTAYATNSWTSLSDQRVKENVQTLALGLDTIAALHPVEYSFKRENLSAANKYGFIAQEIENILPNVVSDSGMSEGNNSNLKAVSYTELIPILVKAVQELKAEVELLKGAK